MIFYRFKNNNLNIVPQNKVLFTFDNIEFIECNDMQHVGADYIALEESEKTILNNLKFARRIFKDTVEYYNESGSKIKEEITKEEREAGLEAYKKIKLLKLKKYNEDIVKNAFNILSIEKETWERQKTEADLYTNDNEASVPFIKTLAEVRGIELSELVEKILVKAEAYSTYVATIIGNQHKIEDELELCETIDDIKSLDLPEYCKFYFDN